MNYRRLSVAALLIGFYAVSSLIGHASAGSICSVHHSRDLDEVFAIGEVRNLDSTAYYANFDLRHGICQIHVYWNFPGSIPVWLRNGSVIEVSGQYFRSHEKHRWEPQIVAAHVRASESEQEESIRYEKASSWTVIPWGAAGEVAGSCYQVSSQDYSILIDCGSFMNTDDMPVSERSSSLDCDNFPFDPSEIDSVVITHAHDDHIGRLHYLIAQGFTGEIHMTEATWELYFAKLDDTVHYSCLPREFETSFKMQILRSHRTHAYLEPFAVSDEITATFIDAGHIPGSASVFLDLVAGHKSSQLIFSGDIGSGHHPFLNPPDLASLRDCAASTLVIESTYGAGDPREYPSDLYGEFFDKVNGAERDGNLVIIPTFSLDRTQRVLAALLQGIRDDRLPSDLAIGVGGKSSCYFTGTYIDLFKNEELCRTYFSESFCSSNPFSGGQWEMIRQPCSDSGDEDRRDPWDYDVIVTPSGTGSTSYSADLIGQFAGNDEVVFIKVGWSPPWTPMGSVDISDQVVSVHDAFSGHADITGLLEYIQSFTDLRQVVVTHGDDGIDARLKLAAEIARILPTLEVLLPDKGEEIPLL